LAHRDLASRIDVRNAAESEQTRIAAAQGNVAGSFEFSAIPLQRAGDHGSELKPPLA
jgi:hypothetical protein